MSEKPEALRLADRMAEGTGLDTQWDAAKELRRLHAENERLREFLLDIRKDAAASHWHRDIDAALRREET